METQIGRKKNVTKHMRQKQSFIAPSKFLQ